VVGPAGPRGGARDACVRVGCSACVLAWPVRQGVARECGAWGCAGEDRWREGGGLADVADAEWVRGEGKVRWRVWIGGSKVEGRLGRNLGRFRN
jgi:hypothetical protein